ncbi:DUF4034 domain-containing protein [Symbioplanes lichenis]|uniref:DUF4034 domain-containing protein n=1 Tax=Symbioplanes lichenis TaxID=1629072 RepID=UPI0027399605|nr:DUF4034 domain-containing protein [Actinoplanes lichenis]
MWPFTKKPTLDPTFGDEEAQAFQAAVRSGDWRATRDLLAATGDTNRRSTYLGLLTAGNPSWIAEWIAAEPDSAPAQLVKGVTMTQWAWEARTARLAKDVSSEQFATFFRRLKLAEDALDAALARDPKEALAWSALITTSMGRQLGLEESRRRFEQAAAIERWHGPAHFTLLNQLHQKWSGVQDAALDFARETVAAMPPGSRLGAMIPIAHFERALRSGDDGYFKRPDVIADVHAAAEKSVLHPGFERGLGAQGSHGWFAIVALGAGNWAGAAWHFDAIGDTPAEYPWGYYGNAAKVYARRRAEAYSYAGR